MAQSPIFAASSPKIIPSLVSLTAGNAEVKDEASSEHLEEIGQPMFGSFKNANGAVRASPFEAMNTYSSNWSDCHCSLFVNSRGKLAIVVLGDWEGTSEGGRNRMTSTEPR